MTSVNSNRKLQGVAALLRVSTLCGAAVFASAQEKVPVSFTAAQADHGKTLFDQSCAACHGATFQARWMSQPGDALFTYIRSKMPPGNPGSADDAAYADLMAYILRSNGGLA